MKPTCHIFLTALFFLFTCIMQNNATASPSEHDLITGPFTDVTKVTTQCIECHVQQGTHILRSNHWTWKRNKTIDGEPQVFSKKNGLVYFAVAAGGNPSQCLTCHISSNLHDERFDPTSPTNIDCLACHDTTGTYKRLEGVPKPEQDLLKIAKNVGRPQIKNCLACHGNKKDSSGYKIHNGIEKDIHFTTSGGTFSCQQCHPSNGKHTFSRTLHSSPGAMQEKGCAACHTSLPHQQKRLNTHSEIIACRTCHIPSYGNEQPEIFNWNWFFSNNSTSVYQNNGQQEYPLISKYGFLQASSLQPVYLWDNGSDHIYTRGDKADKNQLTILQKPSSRSPQSVIAPFTISYGTQLMDAKYRYLISPSFKKDKSFIPLNASWNEAATDGMKKLRLPFSGVTEPVTTVSYRRLNHGVVPAEKALGCMECHGAKSRFDWQSLGYEFDPWQDATPQKEKASNQMPETSTQTPLQLPPIQEVIIPSQDQEGSTN